MQHAYEVGELVSPSVVFNVSMFAAAACIFYL